MKATRRVVAGGGHISIEDDRSVPFQAFAPGVEVCELWHELNPSADQHEQSLDLPVAPLFPQPGQIAVRIVRFLPFDQAAKDAENALLESTGQVATDAGLHSTPTMEYYVVMSGAVNLVVQSGEIEVRSGDCVVLLGGLHSWENRSNQPAELFSVMIGALNSGEAASVMPTPSIGTDAVGSRLIVVGRNTNGRSDILVQDRVSEKLNRSCLWGVREMPPQNRYEPRSAVDDELPAGPSLWKGAIHPGETSDLFGSVPDVIAYTILGGGSLTGSSELGELVAPGDVLIRKGGGQTWRNDGAQVVTFFTVVVGKR